MLQPEAKACTLPQADYSLLPLPAPVLLPILHQAWVFVGASADATYCMQPDCGRHEENTLQVVKHVGNTRHMGGDSDVGVNSGKGVREVSPPHVFKKSSRVP